VTKVVLFDLILCSEHCCNCLIPAAFTVENVPTAKPVQIGSEFPYSPGLVIINLELEDQMQEPEMDRVTVLDLIGHDGGTAGGKRK